MAYLTRYQPGQNLTTGGGAAGAAPAGGAAAPTPSQPASSGAYTDFSAYLNANRDQAAQMAQRINAPVQKQVEDAAQTPSFQPLQAVPQGPFAPFVGLAVNNDAIQANSKIANDANAKRDAASQVLDQAQAPEWAATQVKSPGYTAGIGRLDSFLYGAAGGGQQMADLKAKYAPLLGSVQAPQIQTYTPTPAQPKQAAPQPSPDTWSEGWSQDEQGKRYRFPQYTGV